MGEKSASWTESCLALGSVFTLIKKSSHTLKIADMQQKQPEVSQTLRESRMRHTLCIFDKHLVDIVYFAQAGSPALLSFLLPLGAVGVTPHELVVIQRAIGRALGVAPSAATA